MKPLVHSKNSVNLSFCSYYELNKQKSSHSPKRLVVRSDSHWKIMRYTQGKPIQAEDILLLASNISLLEKLRSQNYQECKLA